MKGLGKGVSEFKKENQRGVNHKKTNLFELYTFSVLFRNKKRVEKRQCFLRGYYNGVFEKNTKPHKY